MSLEAFEPMKYGPIGDAVVAAEPHTEADPVGIYAAILALWSSAINGPVVLEDSRPLVVWTVLVGGSAIGLKGTALRVARKMLEHSIEGFLEARTAGGVSSGPSLTRVLFEKQEETEGTESGVDARVIIIDQEWTEHLRKQNTCPTFASRLRHCWDGETIRHTTTKEHMVVYEPRLGFHAHITPDNWGEFIKPRDAKGGSYNRLLPVMVEGSKVLPYGHKEIYPEIQGLSDAYDWARRNPKVPRVVTLDKHAARRFDELRVLFLDKLVDMPERQRCYVERTPEQIIRVAATLVAAEQKTVVTRKAIDAAWAFVQYSMRSVERLVREDTTVGRSRPVKPLPELIREILTQEGGEADRSRLLRRLGTRATAKSLDLAVEGMADVEATKGVTASGRGRPPVNFRLISLEATDETPEESPATPVVAPVVPEQRKTSETPELALSGGWL